MSERHDVVVLGAGIIGLTSALALARRGAKVLVLDQGEPGAEASSAAAGILGAQSEAKGPGWMADLFVASRALYPGFVAGLEEATGLGVGYERCGVLETAGRGHVEELHMSVGWQEQAGLALERVDGEGARARVPGLGAAVAGGVWFADDGQVEPVRLLSAVRAALVEGGVEVRSGSRVRGVKREGQRAVGAELESGEDVDAGHVVLAAGSWSAQVEGGPEAAQEVRPIRGQVLELRCAERPFGPVVFGQGAYLVPRADGRVLVGATMEDVGFQKGVTAEGVGSLLSAAVELCPALGSASLERTWSGLRPWASEVRLGASEVRGLVLATGHHRNGILLAPISAEIVAAACEGRPWPQGLRAPGR